MIGRRLLAVVFVVSTSTTLASMQASASTTASAPGGMSSPIPFAGGIDQAGTSIAVLPMGHLHDPLNTFFQTLTDEGGWKLTTPIGTGTNGGIALSNPSSGIATVMPFQFLQLSTIFSMKAGRTSGQVETTPGVIRGPSPVASDDPSGVIYAVRSSGIVTVQKSIADAPTTLITLRALRQTPAGKRCGIEAITAVATSPDGVALGVRCARGGTSDVLELNPSTSSNGAWITTSGAARADSEVLRLDQTVDGVLGIVRNLGGRGSILSEILDISGAVHSSGAVPLSGASLRSTAAAIDDAQGASASDDVVLLSGRRSAEAVVLDPGGQNNVLARLPRTTTAVVPAGAGDLGAQSYAAFVVSGSWATVLTPTPAGTRWVVSQRLHVPVPYGSAN